GRVDMLAVVTPSVERSEKIRFTRPYLSNPYVLVVRASDEHLVTLEDMPGKRLAIIRGSSLAAQISHDYPNIGLVDVENPEQAMELVANGIV
ncbi:transporter substrate-binding domain-containing protein, partial [Streptococcus agalactiae]|nr:transporter substrate-binding domain-containing protein [Streptococcus agalactiae]